jgi:mannan endo-1,4-beta-mannosidase
VHTFQNLEPRLGPPLHALAAARAVDAVPMLTWVPKLGLPAINRGDHDADIRAYAQALGAFGDTILFRFGQEMNLPGMDSFGPPEHFIAAWRRIRAAFDQIGAGNVIWVWCPYVQERSTRRFAPYYPGHDVVDVVGLDGYNWGRRRWWHRWRGFDAVFGASYAALRSLAPDKPIILPEIGCAERGGDKAAWMRQTMLRSIPERYPGIEAVVWFDHLRPDHADWRVDSSPAALAAWQEIVGDPRYQLSGAELLDRLSRSRR